jgi:diphthine synthase
MVRMIGRSSGKRSPGWGIRAHNPMLNGSNPFRSFLYYCQLKGINKDLKGTSLEIPMLYLISLGLHDEKDMSLRALATAKMCDSVYVEFYTNRAKTDVKALSDLIGKPVTELDRHGLEERSASLLREAKDRHVAVIVPGDALTATTHVSLLIEAHSKGVKTEIIHGSSIISAVGETGLQVYKLGRTVTLTDPVQESLLSALEVNKKAGLHTLVLLDIGMTAGHGLELLKDRTENDNKVVIACNLGGENRTIDYGTIEELLKGEKDLDTEPAVIIIPGELHFMEKEYLETLK